VSQFKIPASPNNPDRKKRFTQAVDVILGANLEGSYDAAGKDYPDDLPDKWIDPDDKEDKKEKDVAWFSNFGLTDKQGRFVPSIPAGDSYTVRLPKLKGKYVYFDGSEVRKLDTSPAAGAADKVDAVFTLADPPVGLTG
jgi:hypothetical protein